ncbi:hypothetical protein [Herbaspirillum rubrisubalbicans]|uniref:hypothetical protein n=1 Tax=Herbaspirillum rubrisubalbicans TaxID=80842 RepID=UPI00036AD289|nr:hypothetical protein [Herbaspirillum rubrisubalbicans]
MTLIPTQPDRLPAPLYQVIDNLKFANPNMHLDSGTLFWSVGRLFATYERAMSALEEGMIEKSFFLEMDIENFVIRMRIVLNDIAFLIRHILPKHARNISPPSPRGGRSDHRTYEMSMNTLIQGMGEQPELYPEFWVPLSAIKEWIETRKHERDRIIHYKSRILVVSDTDGPRFLTLSTDDDRNLRPMTSRERSTPVANFLNMEMLQLHNLMHNSLPPAIRTYCEKKGMTIASQHSNSQIGGPGVERFKRENLS